MDWLRVISGWPLGDSARWGAPWGLLAAMGALSLLGARSALGIGLGAAARAGRAAGAIFAAGLGLRWALGYWGPLNVNGLGAMWILGAVSDPGELVHYGPGYTELFSWAAAFGAQADQALFAANAAIGAASPVVVWAMGRKLGLPRLRALIPAALLAIDPISVLMGPTESYFPIITLCSAMVALGGLSFIGAAEGRRLAEAALWGAVAIGAAVTGVRLHPMAWVPVALGAGWLLVPRWQGRPGRRLAMATTAALVAGGVMAISSGRVIAGALDAMRSGQLMEVRALHAAPWELPLPAWALLLALGVTIRPRGLAVIAAAYGLAGALLRSAFGQSDEWQACFDRLYLWAPLLALAAARAAPIRDRRRWTAAILAAGALAAGACLRARGAPTLQAEEYRWAREALARVPAGCRIVYVGAAGRRNAVLPTFVAGGGAPGAAVKIDARRPASMRAALGDAPGCARYVRVAMCGSAEGGPGCAEVERQLALREIEGQEHRGVESYRGFDFGPRPRSAVYEVLGLGAEAE